MHLTTNKYDASETLTLLLPCMRHLRSNFHIVRDIYFRHSLITHNVQLNNEFYLQTLITTKYTFKQ